MSRGKASVVGGVVLWVVALMAAPGVAEGTTVTYTVVAGALVIEAPATSTVASDALGTTGNGVLGVVTVTDERASGDASWIAAVTSTNFTTDGGDTTPQVIRASDIDYWSGPATFTAGNGTYTPGQPEYVNKAPLSAGTPLTAFTHGGGTGNNTVSWQAALSIRVPQDSVVGTYTGMVTHSVA